MANGRALPTALLFDTLLGRAWNTALSNYAKANSIATPQIPSNLAKVDGNFALPALGAAPIGDPIDEVGAHDRSVRAQLQEIADAWAVEFEGVMQLTAPVGPGFNLAVQWLRGVTNGADGLGYLGRDHRAAQAQGYASTARAGINARGLPTPPGAMAALEAVAQTVTGLYLDRLTVQMDADREEARRKMLVDAVETLSKLRNDALDAAMDYVFAEMSVMFDVFGENNDYLQKTRRAEQALQARVQLRTSELASWDARMLRNMDAALNGQRQAKALNDRALQKIELTVEQHIKRLRRLSSRAAAIINSAKVSVGSDATESNNVYGDQ